MPTLVDPMGSQLSQIETKEEWRGYRVEIGGRGTWRRERREMDYPISQVSNLVNVSVLLASRIMHLFACMIDSVLLSEWLIF